MFQQNENGNPITVSVNTGIPSKRKKQGISKMSVKTIK